MLAEDLRMAVLQAAVQGKLVEQRLDEGNGDTLFNLIQEERVRLIRDGIIKRTKPLPPIEEEEILFEIPKNWRWVRLGEISTVISKGTTPPEKEGERYIEDGVLFLRVENIGKDFTLDTTVTKYIPEIIHHTELNRSIMQENDVLISIAGALGRTAIIEKKHLPCNINQAISFVRLYPSYIYAHYIKYILNAPVIQKEFLSQKKVTAQPNLTLQIISNIIIPLPPLSEQKRIVTKIEELMKEIKQCEALEREEQILKQTFFGGV